MSEREYLSEAAQRYAEMGNDELLGFARNFDELTEAAQDLLRDELRHRHLELPKPKFATPREKVTFSSENEGDGDESEEVDEEPEEGDYFPEGDDFAENDLAALEAAEKAVNAIPLVSRVMVRRYRDVEEANAASEILHQHGVASFVERETRYQSSPFISLPFWLDVSEADLIEADRILSEME